MFLNLHLYDEALIYFKQAFEIRKNASSDRSKDGNVAATLYNIGLIYYEQALEMKNDA